MIGETEVNIAGQQFVLNTLHTLYWKQQQALLLADLHIGKAAHFRKNGIAMPANYLTDDFVRLSAAVNHYKPQKIFILGDLIHADHNRELLLFERWLNQHNIVGCHLILGNHDRHTKAWLSTLPIHIYESRHEISNCILTHMPEESDDSLVISGHIHPGVVLHTSQRQKIKVPVFLVNEKQIILPAFSAFTGLDTAYETSREFDRYVITKNKIIAMDQ